VSDGGLGLPGRSAEAPAPDALAAGLRPARAARQVTRTPHEPERGYTRPELPSTVLAAAAVAAVLVLLALGDGVVPGWVAGAAVGFVAGFAAAKLERGRDAPGAHERWEVRRDGEDVVVEHLWPVARPGGTFAFARGEVERHPPTETDLFARGDPHDRHRERTQAGTELARRAWLRRRGLPAPVAPAVVDRAEARVPEPLADRLLEHLRRRFGAERRDPGWQRDLQPLLDELPVHLERLRGGWLSDDQDRRMDLRLRDAAGRDEGVGAQVAAYERKVERPAGAHGPA
jgi:hypothetical protein